MNKGKISVVVPIYNAEKYLKKCLDSIINQTYDNLEIILVNDGSTDKSLEICESVRNGDSRITIINKENKGVSTARNKGIESSNGEFIIFIDADDYLDKNMFEILVEDAIKNNIDLVMCGYRNVDINGNILYESSPMDEKYFDVKTFKNNLFKTNYYRELICNKLFRLEIIKNNNIRFREDIHINENILFLLDFAKYGYRYSYDNEKLYNFLYNRSGATHAKFNLKKVSVLSSYIRLLDYDLEKSILNKVKYKYLFEGYAYLYLMKKINIDNSELKNNLTTFKTKYYQDIKNEKTISLKKKVSLWFMMHFNYIYCKIRKDI